MIPEDQPGTAANLVEGLTHPQHGCAAFFTAGAVFTAALTGAFAFGTVTLATCSFAAALAAFGRVRDRTGAAAVEYLHVGDQPVVGDPGERWFVGNRQHGRRRLSGAQVPHHARTEFPHGPRSGLNVRFGLHIAKYVGEGVAGRCVDGAGGLVVTGRDGQSSEHALPLLVEGHDRARHGALVGLGTAVGALAASFAFGPMFTVAGAVLAVALTGPMLAAGFASLAGALPAAVLTAAFGALPGVAHLAAGEILALRSLGAGRTADQQPGAEQDPESHPQDPGLPCLAIHPLHHLS